MDIFAGIIIHLQVNDKDVKLKAWKNYKLSFDDH